MRVAGLVAGQAQPALQQVRGVGEARLVPHHAGPVQQLVRNAAAGQDAHVVGGVIQLRLGAEQLDQPGLAVVVGEPGLVAQVVEAVAAVFGEAQHPALVAVVGLLGAVGEQLTHPADHRQVEPAPDHQRAVRRSIQPIALRGRPGAAQGVE